MFNFKKTVRKYPAATRVVKSTRWIHTNELKIGMYVAELDRPWEETNFMFQGFVIDDLKTLHDVQLTAEYVCVSSEKVAQVSADSTHRLCAAMRG